MTRAEVQALLGAPPGDYADKYGRLFYDERLLKRRTNSELLQKEIWEADDIGLAVYFREDGTVADKSLWRREWVPEPPKLYRRFRPF
jgi:hypothetical protein